MSWAAVKELFQEHEVATGEPVVSGKVVLPPYPGLVISRSNPEGGATIDEEVPLPLTPTTVPLFRPFFQPAPFGRGLETVVDENVRKCLQLNADQFFFAHPEWNNAIQALATQSAVTMGVTEAVEVIPYKLLLYEEGSYFLPHQDTEKEKGMFGTLIVQLPSVYTGGQLVMHLPEGDRTCDMGESGPSRHSYFFSAHYADLNHEIKPLTSGIRLAVTYSLCWRGLGPSPSFNELIHCPDPITRAVQEYNGEEVLIELKHQYTEGAFKLRGIQALKRSDAELAQQLIQSGQTLPEERRFDLYLMFWQHEVTFAGEEGYRSRDVDWEVIEQCDDAKTFDAQGNPVKQQFQVPENYEWPDGETIEEELYTGNEGASKITAYHTSFLVVTPRCSGIDIEMRIQGVRQMFEQIMDKCSLSSFSDEEKRKLIVSLMNSDVLKKNKEEIHRWRKLLKVIASLKYVEGARLFMENFFPTLPSREYEHLTLILPLLDIWKNRSLQETVQPVFKVEPYEREYSLTNSTAECAADLFVSICPENPTPEQLQVLDQWATEYSSSMMANLASLNISFALSQFLMNLFRVCPYASDVKEVVTNVFKHVDTCAPERSMWTHIPMDVHYSSILKGVFASRRRWKETGLLEHLLTKLTTHLKPNCDDMLPFLTLVDDHPQRESWSALLLKNPPTPCSSWLLQCSSLTNPLLQDLARKEMDRLRAEIAPMNRDGWRMPFAKITGNSLPPRTVAQIENFLHGPEQEFQVTGCFSGIDRARRFRLSGTGFTIRYGTATGRASNSAVYIFKTNEHWQSQQRQCEESSATLAQLESLYNASTPLGTKRPLSPSPVSEDIPDIKKRML